VRQGQNAFNPEDYYACQSGMGLNYNYTCASLTKSAVFKL